MANANPLISVIIPVYNVGEFLAPCLDSLMAQTYENLEILLIDDGSTDGSGEVCDTYAQKDNRFKAIHKENGGVSSARNLGLDIAQGEYIAFVDADDRVLPDYFEVLYRDLTEHNVDASFCDYILVDEDGAELPNKITRFSETKCIEELKTLLLSTSPFRFVWGGLFSAATLQGHRFPNQRYGEDSFFMFHWLCKNPVIFVNSYRGYMYLQRQSSAVHAKTVPEIIKKADHLQLHSSVYLNLPIKDQEIQKYFLARYAQAIHDIAYLSALPETCNLKPQNLKEHVRNVLPDIRLLPRNLRINILLYAKMPWLYNALARIHHKLQR